MRLPSGYSTYDYSTSPERKGWGKGWPSCTAGPTARITLTRSRTYLTQIHSRIAPLVAILLNEIERRGFLFYNPGTWGGACRAVSGTRTPSNHSWCLAFDMNAPDNPYTYSNSHTIPDWAYAILRAYGFGLGADYTGKKDWMHAEFMGTPADADVMTALATRNFTKLEDDMTPEQDSMLRNVYGAIFHGGPSMNDGQKSIAVSLDQLQDVLWTGGPGTPLPETVAQRLIRLEQGQPLARTAFWRTEDDKFYEANILEGTYREISKDVLADRKSILDHYRVKYLDYSEADPVTGPAAYGIQIK